MTDTNPSEQLSAVLSEEDPTEGLWQLVDSGWADEHLPELPALRLEQDPIHRHKDVLTHTIVVTSQSPARLRVRLAALFHDVGKPRTRSYEHGGVTFRHHEAVGARMTRKRMPKLGYQKDMTSDVAQLVFLSGRFKGYTDGWSDSAVRRYARDGGSLLGDLNDLVRSDCTSRNPRRVAALHEALDDLERRIAELAREEAIKAERPEVDGDRVIAHLGIEPGPVVGQALKFLLELKRSEGDLGETAVLERLDAWWLDQQK
jgi:poly(A) polymerase